MTSEESPPHPSSSHVQQTLEKKVLERLQQENKDWESVNWQEAASTLGLSSIWSSTKPDAIWWVSKQEKYIIAEVYIRTDALKPGNRRKIATDILKLISIEKNAQSKFPLELLLIIPESLLQKIAEKSWLYEAMKLVKVQRVTLLPEELELLAKATKLQGAGQSRIIQSQE